MEDLQRAVTELCDAATAMRDTANTLWWANNPDTALIEGAPPSLDKAQAAHSAAFSRLTRAEYYARKAMREMTPNKD